MSDWLPAAAGQRLARWWFGLSAPVLLVMSFALLISVGTTGLLWLPGLYTGEPLGFVDALYTMTSAVCVTGLVVVDTATWFTRAGHLWILLFIQLGGLGLITLTTLVIGALGQQLSLRSEIVAGATADLAHRKNVFQLVLNITRVTFIIEAVGALILWVQWAPRFGVGEAAWHAVFHAINAFCNAGFSTFPDSLAGEAKHPLILLPVAILIVLGGIGYLSGEEALHWYRNRGQGARRLSMHTWAALVTTGVLLVAGTVLFGVFEWSRVLEGMSFVDRVVNAFFMSVTPRSGGFHTVDYAQLGNSSGYLTILLMVVGGSPGSTAGGIKTTALAVLIAMAWSRLKGRRHVQLHGRTVPQGTVDRTVSVALLAFTMMTAAVFILSFTETRGDSLASERQAFLPLFFEAVSAFSTVGLSMGATPELSPTGRVVSVVLMFVGRIGLLSFFAALSLRRKVGLGDFRPAREDLLVG